MPIAVRLADGTLLTGVDFEPLEGHEGTMRCVRPGLLLRLTVTSESAYGGMVHQLSVQNTGFGRVALARLSPLWMTGSETAPEGLDGIAIWIQGKGMHGAALSHRFGAREQHADMPGEWRRETPDGTEFISSAMAITGEPGGDEQILLGFITTARQFSDIRLTTDAAELEGLRLDCGCELDGWVLNAGESVSSEKLLVLGPGPAAELAERYAAATDAEMQARVPEHVPTGWCSWYFFYNRVSERDVLSNLDALVAQGRQVEVVQIDDGYQSATGDWLTPNERFPSGMAALAERIDAAGFTPGLWLAPLIMHRDSRVLAEHPEWALNDSTGARILLNTWLGEVAVLDCTHPNAQEWLRHVFRTVTRDWGYPYLKLDALTFACQPGARYHQPNTTAAANLRLGLQLAREGAGEETFILGCTCPFGPAIGLVDAMRVGPDVGQVWFDGWQPSVRHGLRLALPRFWMHRRLWLNDPDCLVARDTNTSLTDDEARFLASGIAMSGGLVMLSDDLATLSRERLPITQAILPPLGLAARPLDILQRETPAVFALPLQRGEDAWTLAAIFNWGDTPADFNLDFSALGFPGPVHAFEFWQQRYEGRFTGTLRASAVAPHSCRVFALRPARGALQLLSVSGHISQGAAQLESVAWRDTHTLVLRFAEGWTRPVQAWLRLPPGCTGLEIRPSGLTLRGGDVLAAPLDPAISGEWTLRAAP